MSETPAVSPDGSRPPGPISVNRQGREMSWSGIQTFMKAPVCLTPEDLRAGQVDVAIGGAPWDGTATGLTGTHLGPRAIRHGDYITALFARRAVMEALTGTAMRRIGLTQPDYVDPRSAGTGAARTFRGEGSPDGT
jgi:arginase family enzyme